MSEEQQQAQRITDGLYHGPYQVAQDVARLQQLGVTTVVSVLGEDQDFDKVAVENGKKHWVQVTDRVEAEADMKAALPGAVAQLKEHRPRSNPVILTR